MENWHNEYDRPLHCVGNLVRQTLTSPVSVCLYPGAYRLLLRRPEEVRSMEELDRLRSIAFTFFFLRH